MGRTVSQRIPTLINGVSRQPHHVRSTSQVEAAENVYFSVTSGGFEKRPGTQHIASLTGLSLSDNYKFHVVDRSESQKYGIVIGSGKLKVYDLLTGVEQTVNAIAAGPASYINTTGDNLSLVTIADYTFIANKTTSVAMEAASPPAVIPTAYAYVKTGDSTKNYRINLNGGNIASYTGSDNSNTIASNLASQIVGGGGTWTVDIHGTNQGNVLRIRRVDQADFTFEVVDGSGDTLMHGWKNYGPVKAFNQLPPKIWTDTIVKIASDPSEGTSAVIWVKFNGNVWVETVDPTAANSFDASTMPHQLVRQGDGTWTLEESTWNPRTVGDVDTVPPPTFVGNKINDVFSIRNRLGFLSNENVVLTQVGDYFNFWPDKAIEVLDSDPIDIATSSNRVTVLKHAVPIRKNLFVTSDTAQFELTGGDVLTPKNATLDLTTAYAAADVKPSAVGDSLYFAGTAQEKAVIYEYFYDQNSLSNTAEDISKHIYGYIDGISHITGAPVAGRLFVQPDGAYYRLFVNTSYWQADQKVQNAWSMINFDNGTTLGLAVGVEVMNDYVYLLMCRNGTEWSLEKLPVDSEPALAHLGFAPCLDQRAECTGVYDAGTNTTTWILPYPHLNDVTAIAYSSSGGTSGKKLNVSYSGTATLTAAGQQPLTIQVGRTYNMNVELSKIYLREKDGSAVVSGRLQLRDLDVFYKNTGYFEIVVTPEARDERTYKFTGGTIGSVIVGTPAIAPHGFFKARIGSRADTVTIQIKNNTHLPCTITGASWSGFYNDIARQG